MAKIWTLTAPNAEHRAQKLSLLLVGVQQGAATLEDSCGFLQN